jgi:hypothetical protein
MQLSQSSPIRLFTINNWFALQKLSNIFSYLFLVLSIFLRFSGIFRFSKIPAWFSINSSSFSTNSKYVGLIGDFNSRTGEDDDYANVNFEHGDNNIDEFIENHAGILGIYIVPNITGCSKLNTFPSILTHNTNSHSFSNIWTWFTKFSLNPNSIPIPPEYTRYSSDEAFNQIEHELHSFSTNSKYVGLIGDFNSRTGEDDDYVNETLIVYHLISYELRFFYV